MEPFNQIIGSAWSHYRFAIDIHLRLFGRLIALGWVRE